MNKYVCDVCGSDDIEVKAWVKANSLNDENAIVEWCEDEIPECWCNNCQERTKWKNIQDK